MGSCCKGEDSHGGSNVRGTYMIVGSMVVLATNRSTIMGQPGEPTLETRWGLWILERSRDSRLT